MKKDGWEIKRLGEVCKIEYGTRIVRKQSKGSLYPVYGGGGPTFFTDSFNREDCLIISRFGISEKCTRFVKGKFFLNDSGLSITPLNSFLLRQKYVDAWALYVNDVIYSYGRGAAQRNLDIPALRLLPIPFPPLSEQQRIVEILDEAFDGIATAKDNTEKNLANARELFDAWLNSVFSQRGEGWVMRRLSSVAHHSLGKMLDKSKNKGELKPYLRNLNVRWFSFDLSDILQMPFQPQEVEKYTAKKGDVMICEGGYPGRAAVWNEDYPVYFQKALHRVRFHEPAYGKWFVYYLYAQDKSGELKRHFSGTGIQHFTGEALAQFELPLPPQSELHKLLENIEYLFAETQRLESIYRQKIEALDSLKQSLLHQAFSGAL